MFFNIFHGLLIRQGRLWRRSTLINRLELRKRWLSGADNNSDPFCMLNNSTESSFPCLSPPYHHLQTSSIILYKIFISILRKIQFFRAHTNSGILAHPLAFRFSVVLFFVPPRAVKCGWWQIKWYKFNDKFLIITFIILMWGDGNKSLRLENWVEVEEHEEDLFALTLLVSRLSVEHSFVPCTFPLIYALFVFKLQFLLICALHL